MPRNVAPNVDGKRESGNVRGIRFDRHVQRGRIPAEPLRSDAQRIYCVQQLTFQRRILRIGMRFIKRAAQGFFGKQGAQFKIAADTDAEYDRRAGIGTRFPHSL